MKFLNKSPIMHLIGDNAVNRYFKVFSILVQLKQQRRVMALLWKTLRNTRNIKSVPENYLRKLLFVRSVADDLLEKYESFVCHFCIEKAWKSLQYALVEANSFNRLFKVHSRYLDSVIESITFGGVEKADTFGHLKKTFALVSQLNSLANLACVNFEVLETDHFETEIRELFENLATCRVNISKMMKNTYENYLPLTEV